MSDIAKRISAAMNAFQKIGKANGSSPPETTSNSLGMVYELLVADRLLSAAKTRRELAQQALRQADMIAADYKPGDYTPYTSGVLNINVKRNKDSGTLDATKLTVALSKKLGEAETQKILKAATKPRKGNTTISVSIVGGEEA